MVTKMVTDYLKLVETERHSIVLGRSQQRLLKCLFKIDTVGVRGSRPLVPTISKPRGIRFRGFSYLQHRLADRTPKDAGSLRRPTGLILCT